MPTHKVFYFSHAPQNVYDIIREEVPPGFELVTIDEDSDSERNQKIAECEVVIVAAKPMRRACGGRVAAEAAAPPALATRTR
jgi:hypothetical protein